MHSIDVDGDLAELTKHSDSDWIGDSVTAGDLSR